MHVQTRILIGYYQSVIRIYFYFLQPSEAVAKKEKINVLDSKRSNAINIALVKLPPINTIKSAVLKMDNECINREGIEVSWKDMLIFNGGCYWPN